MKFHLGDFYPSAEQPMHSAPACANLQSGACREEAAAAPLCGFTFAVIPPEQAVEDEVSGIAVLGYN